MPGPDRTWLCERCYELLIQRESLKSFCMGATESDKLSCKVASAGVWKRKIIIARSYSVLIV